jgi:site-specific recombinase XerD
MFIKRYAVKFLDRHNVSAHVLRHTFCTHSLERGLSLEHVRIMAGHSDIGITSRYYAHLCIKPETFVGVTELKRERQIPA